jgi:flagellar biosynthesis/type III secretory pathway chaperone
MIWEYNTQKILKVQSILGQKFQLMQRLRELHQLMLFGKILKISKDLKKIVRQEKVWDLQEKALSIQIKLLLHTKFTIPQNQKLNGQKKFANHI